MADPDPQALEGAVAALRRVIANLRKTKAPAELLADTEAQLAALHQRLAPFDHPGPYAQGTLDMGEGSFIPGARNPASFFPYSPIVGPLNPIAPPVSFVQRGEDVVAEHVFDAPWCGPPTAVHGGVIAMVFDELLGCVNVVNELGGFTGTLTLRYLALTPIGKPIAMRAWIDRSEGRKTWAKGTMHCGDTLCAEAEGVFIVPRSGVIEHIKSLRRGEEQVS
jgi:acyl-coenzyme A thioesterase PaaI-like protein